MAPPACPDRIFLALARQIGLPRPMSAPRKLKKSESLEIRIPHPTKEAFMARCRRDGRSASEALRDFIEAEIAPAAPRVRWKPLAAGALIAALVAAVAAPSLAHQLRAVPDSPPSRAEFTRLDADRDGRLSLAEYLRR
jgi:hypothetical protein